MTRLDHTQLVFICAGSRNCGNEWQTFWITSTCGLAGGMIGLAGGPLGSAIGSLAGKAACSWFCHYAS